MSLSDRKLPGGLLSGAAKPELYLPENTIHAVRTTLFILYLRVYNRLLVSYGIDSSGFATYLGTSYSLNDGSESGRDVHYG